MKRPFAAEQRQLSRGLRVQHMPALNQWLPVAVNMENPAQTTLVWRYLADKRLLEAFFADSLRGQEASQRQVCETDFAQLQHICQDLPYCPPRALIFHSSRCGSTLLMQLLACLPHCIALAEPPVLESCLQWLHSSADPLRNAQIYLPMVLQALCQQRFSDEQASVIKLDSWHICDLPLLRAALPETPFYFLYRAPAEILASHQKQLGPQMVPGLLDIQRLGVSPDTALFDSSSWAEQVLLRYFQAAHTHAQAGQLQLLHYTDLPSLLWQRLLAEWQIPASATQMAAMQARAGFDAKSAQRFQPNSSAAPTVSANLQAAYAALEALRQQARA